MTKYTVTVTLESDAMAVEVARSLLREAEAFESEAKDLERFEKEHGYDARYIAKALRAVAEQFCEGMESP